ncbi:response regulator [Microlunatus soli]|uniref:response regulator n=1 Tax=Microlunatus soli TaxID=630515 RepID=UPI001E57DBAB|nr:response regulator transcription factor [Microlunatus soli]
MDPATAPAAIGIMIVDDDPIVRSGLRMMLDGLPDLRLVGEASNGRDCLAQLRSLAPDLILMDLRMPVLDGIETTRRIAEGSPATRVLALTTFDTGELALAALAAGAVGFLLKDTPPQDLVDAVRAAGRGEPTLAPTAARALLDHVRQDHRTASRDAARARLADLSPRERDVGRAVADGLSNADIADRLSISLPTVKTYISRLLDHLDVANRVQIALLVQQADLDPPPPSH